MFVEEVLTARVGDVGKKLHTARSRNDQVALDLRMYLMEENDAISAALKQLIATVTDKAECYQATIMPGYTHLQRAQPVLRTAAKEPRYPPSAHAHWREPPIPSTGRRKQRHSVFFPFAKTAWTVFPTVISARSFWERFRS